MYKRAFEVTNKLNVRYVLYVRPTGSAPSLDDITNNQQIHKLCAFVLFKELGVDLS